MKFIYYFLIFIIVFIILIKIIRKELFNYLININQDGKYLETKNFYNNYFIDSKKKKDRRLINNVAFFRYGFMSSIYDADIKILKLNEMIDNETILNLNNSDCNFDVFLIQNIIKLKKNIKIISAKTNLLEVEKCNQLMNSLNYDSYINIIFINDFDEIDKILKKKFKRIILRENIGKLNKRNLLLSKLKSLLYDQFSFIYLKTLTFNQVKDNDYILKKQLDIIDFWNYNFSTDQDIINDFVSLNYRVKFKKLNVIYLSIFYNPEDVINLLKLYFIDLDLNISDLINWMAVYTINILNIRAYPELL